MDQRKALILAGVLGVLIIAIIVGTIVYLSRNVQTNETSSQKVVTSSALPIPSFSSGSRSPQGSTPPANPNFKTYTGAGFQIQYPKTWGLLTCSNSANIEFDPESSTDQLKVACSSAVKPITVLVRTTAVTCPGSKVTFGNTAVLKSVDTSLGRTDYRWCTQTNPMLDISARYSNSGGKAASTTDYSSQVEDMISRIYFGAGS